MQTQSDWLGDVLKIAIGIALGGVILWRLNAFYLQYQVEQAAQEIQAQSDLMAQKLNEQQRQRKAVMENTAAVERRRETERAQAMLDADAARRRKDVAWQQYYHPAPECVDTSRSDVSVECGNAYIRARRQFEASWKP